MQPQMNIFLCFPPPIIKKNLNTYIYIRRKDAFKDFAKILGQFQCSIQINKFKVKVN